MTDIDTIRKQVTAAISEWREWESSATAIANVLDDVEGALDAEDRAGAVEDALSNLRLLDWSSPKAMPELIEDMTAIENGLDELKQEADDEPGEKRAIVDDDLTDDERRSFMAICVKDDMLATEYIVHRMPNGHAVATNRQGSDFDLTDFCNTEDA